MTEVRHTCALEYLGEWSLRAAYGHGERPWPLDALAVTLVQLRPDAIWSAKGLERLVLHLPYAPRFYEALDLNPAQLEALRVRFPYLDSRRETSTVLMQVTWEQL